MAVFSRKFEYKDATLTTVDGQEIPIGSNIMEFTYNESIYSPFVCGNISFQDSTDNYIGSLPLQGGEKISIKVNGPDEQVYEYKMVVWSITDRSTKDRFQIYNMKVISEEAIINESVKITVPLKGNVQEVVPKVIKDFLKSSKPVMVEKSLFNVSLIPGRMSPFNILQRMSSKAVSGKSNFSGSKGKNQNTEIDADTIKGTAGYFFYENKNGYFFESIDKTCATSNSSYDGRDIIGDYYYDPNMQENERKILSFGYDNEINIMKKMRLGGYSSIICCYNFSTGKYEEKVWSLSETYKNMVKLGTQEKLGLYQEQASESPTRVMSMILDHETWYNGLDVTNDGENTEYPDYSKYYAAQSIGRQTIIGSYKMNISLPGNPALTVGEKINVYIPNTVPGEDRSVNPWDKENSGTYLISGVEHVYNTTNSQVVSKLELIRDSLGLPKGASSVK